MNFWALSAILRANDEDLDQVLVLYEEHMAKEPNPRLAPYEVEQYQFLEYLKQLHIHSSDAEVFEDFFLLLDNRNRRIVNIIELLISLAPLTTRSTQELITRCFVLFDRKRNKMIEKVDVIKIMKLLNSSFDSLGDRALTAEVVYDFVNSVYTSAGKIDGEIYYPDFVEYMTIHPIVELFISPQFQGSLQSKIQQQEEMERREKEEAKRKERQRSLEETKE